MYSENGNGNLAKTVPSDGKFQVGNKLGRANGNPFVNTITRYRKLAYQNVTDDRFVELWCDLMDLTKSAKSEMVRLEAIREVLDRLLGKAQPMTPDQIQAIQINVGLSEPKPIGVTVNGHNGNGVHHDVVDSD